MSDLERDDDLPSGWRSAAANDGKKYYFHEGTGETTWERPTKTNDDDDGSIADEQQVHVQEKPKAQNNKTDPVTSQEQQYNSNFLPVLQPHISKLSIIFITSFMLMLQASIKHGSGFTSEFQYQWLAAESECVRTSSPTGALPAVFTNFASSAMSYLSYAVSVGTISFIFSGALFLVAHFRPEKISDVQFLKLSVIQWFAGFQFLWWFIATFVLTFPQPSLNMPTTMLNSYFALWIATATCTLLCVDTFEKLKGKFHQYEAEAAKKTNLKLFTVLFFSSFVLSMACIFSIASCDNKGHAAWGLVVGLISCFLSPVLHCCRDRLGPRNEKFLAGSLLLLWFVCTLVVTFSAPFVTIGNGFLASLCGLVVISRITFKIVYQKDIDVVNALKNSLSVKSGAAAPQDSEMPASGNV